MPKGDGEDYLEPEHAEELRKLRAGGLSDIRGCDLRLAKIRERLTPPSTVQI